MVVVPDGDGGGSGGRRLLAWSRWRCVAMSMTRVMVVVVMVVVTKFRNEFSGNGKDN